MRPTRRTFIALGASTGVAAALARFYAPAPALANPTCTSPVPPGTKAVPWKIPKGQTTVNRVSAYTYTAAQWKLLHKAYAAMRALPNSDPRSLEAQQNMHAWYCAQCAGSPSDIHGSWTFFVWHRGFLFFHERILGSLVKDPTLRLPYWDWENPSRRKLPAQYYTGALNDATRDLLQGQSVERNAPGYGYYDLNLVPADIALNFPGIGGDSTSSGDVETGCHGFVHMSVGGLSGDMGNLETAAGDPVFFAHHGNIDRLWYSWENYDAHTDPDGAFPALTFRYYDETKTWRSLTADQMSPTTKLAYAYDTVVTPPLSLASLREIELLVQRNVVVGPPPPGPERDAIAQASTTVVSLRQLEFRGTGAFVVEAHDAAGTHVVGRFFVVPHGTDSPMTMASRSANLRFVVPVAIAKALAQGGARITVKRSRANGRRTGQLIEGFRPAVPAKLAGLTLSVR
jgi:hypothetical protein